MPKYSGKHLRSWGIESGPVYGKILSALTDDMSYEEAYAIAMEIDGDKPEKISVRTNDIPIKVFLEPENADEQSNYDAVMRHMDSIVRLPSVVDAAVMPDAMPSGSELGTIPVGGVVATKGTIHPGMHSADICCSMAITVFNRDEDVGRVLDAAMKVSHFGLGKRSKSEVRANKVLKAIMSKPEWSSNMFLNDPKMIDAAENHFMTQGDGNHFLYVGHLESTGQLALVTHHGSRSLGGLLYKYGMASAKKHTSIVADRIPEHQSWLDVGTKAGDDYWEALQVIRDWTMANHYEIHDGIASRIGNKVVDRFWNEHNFVFLKDDLFYHAKGATPSYSGFSPSDSGKTLIPMNMSQPILVATHSNSEKNAFFAPHGAGRNFSRTEYERRIAARFGESKSYEETRTLSALASKTVLEEETKGLDVRFYTGKADVSELPSSYKSAEQVTRQIKKHALADIVDRVLPGGSIMAGEIEKFWKKKNK